MRAMVRSIALSSSVALAASGCIAELVGFDAGGYDAVIIRGQDTTVVVPPIDVGADPARPVEAPAAARMIDGLEYRVEVATDGAAYRQRIRLTTWVRNPGTRPAELELGVCAFEAQVHRRPARAGTSLWPPTQGPSLCPPTLITRRIQPGDSIEHAEHVYPEALPDGRYYLSVRATLPSGEYQLDAGSTDVVLAIPGLEYRVRLVARSGTERSRPLCTKTTAARYVPGWTSRSPSRWRDEGRSPCSPGERSASVM